MKLAALPALFALALSAPTFASDLSDTLMRAGLDPDALAAAGVVSGEVAGIVSDVADHLDANPTDLSSADADYLAAKADVSRLTRLVQRGQASAQDVTDLATAKQDLATAESDREAALDAVFDAGTAGLSASEAATLSTIRANREWATPIEFLAKDRTDADWLALIEALTDERVSADEGTSPDPACSSLLLTERADSAVSAAETAYDTNAVSVASSWQTAVSGS